MMETSSGFGKGGKLSQNLILSLFLFLFLPIMIPKIIFLKPYSAKKSILISLVASSATILLSLSPATLSGFWYLTYFGIFGKYIPQSFLFQRVAKSFTKQNTNGERSDWMVVDAITCVFIIMLSFHLLSFLFLFGRLEYLIKIDMEWILVSNCINGDIVLQ